MAVPASAEMVRRKNSLLVLSALRQQGRLAHTELSAATGLASATVSAITADLERAGVIARSEQLSGTGRGRPRVLFEPRRGWFHAVVAVISSDAIQYSLVDYSGRLIDRFAAVREPSTLAPSPVPGLRGRELATMVADGLARLLSRSGLDSSAVHVVSISSKGLVDETGTRLVWSPALGTDEVDFAAQLPPAWRNALMVNNETRLVAEAVWSRQASARAGGRGVAALAALSLGHSIGLGIARAGDGGIPHVVAPNFGHMLHIPNGALCRCGASGCIEAYAGFYGILRMAFEVPADTLPAKFVPLAEIEKIAAMARSGHRMAGYAFRQAGIALGSGLSRLFSLHGHMPVHVTGPGVRFFDLLQGGLYEGLAGTHVARLGGMPEIRVETDEPGLVFEGHMGLALSRLDQDIVLTGLSGAPLSAQG